MMSPSCYNDAIPECCVTTTSIYGDCKSQPGGQAGCRASGLQDSWPHVKAVTKQKDIPSRSQAIGTRQETTSKARDHFITKVNKVDVEMEAAAFVFIALLLDG